MDNWTPGKRPLPDGTSSSDSDDNRKRQKKIRGKLPAQIIKRHPTTFKEVIIAVLRNR